MKVLLTNDDGIQAAGLHAFRHALLNVPQIELAVIAPDSNRSAIGRGITTRAPLYVEQVEFGDGTSGFMTDGTPVDCVRFATLGLLEWQPELIVSGINHGANLGDDITYSGTVAAAFEGVILGVPAIAVSQQARRGQMGWSFGEDMDFADAAAFAAGLVERIGELPLEPGTLLNVNVPAGPIAGARVCRLGKRVYRDKLELQGDEGARRRYRIYGDDPSYVDEDGTDFEAIAEHCVAVTPVHFDLTSQPGIAALGGFDLAALIPESSRETPPAEATLLD
jgi:5'-nucleotidase